MAPNGFTLGLLRPITNSPTTQFAATVIACPSSAVVICNSYYSPFKVHFNSGRPKRVETNMLASGVEHSSPLSLSAMAASLQNGLIAPPLMINHGGRANYYGGRQRRARPRPIASRSHQRHCGWMRMRSVQSVIRFTLPPPTPLLFLPGCPIPNCGLYLPRPSLPPT